MEILDLGQQDYAKTWDLQKRLVQERKDGGPDTLILVEHPSVVTLGREHKGPEPSCGMPVLRVERGGRATFHGPGQLVGYPILDLSELGFTVDRYLRSLENALIEAVRPWAEARRIRGFTGVWVSRQKLASIGVAVHGTVTYHGFALNVATDLSKFAPIQPCGLEPQAMTSLTELTGQPVPMEEVKGRVLTEMKKIFQKDSMASHPLPAS